MCGQRVCVARAEEFPAHPAGNVKICISGAIPFHLSSERAKSFLPYSLQTPQGQFSPSFIRKFFDSQQLCPLQACSRVLPAEMGQEHNKGRLTPLLSAGLTPLPNFPHIPLLPTQKTDKMITKSWNLIMVWVGMELKDSLVLPTYHGQRTFHVIHVYFCFHWIFIFKNS